MLNCILLQILSVIIIEMTSENMFTSFSWSCWFRLFSIRQQVKSVFSLNFNKLYLKQLFHISAKIGVEIFTFSQRSKVLRSKKKSQRGATKAPTLESKLQFQLELYFQNVKVNFATKAFKSMLFRPFCKVQLTLTISRLSGTNHFKEIF